jgi:hypothetical protein
MAFSSGPQRCASFTRQRCSPADQGITTALWGARHPGQLQPVGEVSGWGRHEFRTDRIADG